MNLETFEPRTPTEMALWNELRAVRAKLYYMERIEPPSIKNIDPIELASLPNELKLSWGTRLYQWLEPDGRLVVRIKAKSTEGEFGTQYSVMPIFENKFVAGDYAMRMHEQQLHLIADFLQTGKLET